MDKCWSVWNHDEPIALWHSSQLLFDTVDPEEQLIILQQLEAVIKKNNLNTIDVFDDIAHMCNN